MSDYNSLKIDELKELLKERGLSTTGRKVSFDKGTALHKRV